MSDDLAAIRKRADAATPGPWHAVTTGTKGGDHWYVCDDGQSIALVHASGGEDEEQREPDAEFIAHAREDVPALLDRIAELEAERDGLAAVMKVEKIAGGMFDAYNLGACTALENARRHLHDWAANHAGLDGAYFARIWERNLTMLEAAYTTDKETTT